VLFPLHLNVKPITPGLRAKSVAVRHIAGLCLLQIAVACALRHTRLAMLRRVSGACRPVARYLLGRSEDRILWAIEAAGRRLPRSSTCLVKVIVAELLPGSPQRPVFLTIGIRRGPAGALESHAWVH
jgi:hypothetical protein